jgi:secreted trypsin-like serine protease
VWGGATAASESQVFLLDLRFDNGDTGICSAVLISPRVLLTAAHCADPADEGAANVTIAATNEPNDSMLMMSDMIPVTSRALHPSWNPSNTDSDFDLALLLLSRAPVGGCPRRGRRGPRR